MSRGVSFSYLPGNGPRTGPAYPSLAVPSRPEHRRSIDRSIKMIGHQTKVTCHMIVKLQLLQLQPTPCYSLLWSLRPKPRDGIRPWVPPQSRSFSRFPLHPLMRNFRCWVVVHHRVLPVRPKWVERWCLSSEMRRDWAIGESLDWNMRRSCSICQQLATPCISGTHPETDDATVLKLYVKVRHES